MAEAAGLASSIITFISVTVKVVSRVQEYLAEAGEAPQNLLDVGTILPLLSTSLDTVRKQTLATQLQPEVVAQLQGVVRGALTQIEILERCVKVLTPPRQSSTLQRVDKAVKGVFKYDAQIDQALAKLKQYLDTISFYHTISSVATTQDIVKALRSIGGDVGTRRVEEENKLVKAWIAGASRDEYIDICIANRAPGTCQWLQQSSNYRKWSSPDFVQDAPKFLWVHGPPGIGKTFIAASILSDLEKAAPKSTVAFFWSSEKHNATLTDIVRSWLTQLCDADSLNCDLVKPIWNHDQNIPGRTKSIWKALTLVAQHATEPLTFVIDGLDEYQQQQHLRDQQALPADKRLSYETVTDFVSRLKDALQDVRCRFICISQSEAEIRSSFSKASLEAEGLVAFEHEVISSDTEQDLLAYAQLVVNQKLPKKDPALKSDLAKALAEKAESQMMWIMLQAKDKNYLKPSMTEKKLRQVVAATPSGLNNIYQANLDRIRKLPKEDGVRAIRLLLWLLYALRPLSVQELFEASLISDKIDDDQFPDDELLEDPDEDDVRNDITTLCGTFVTLDTGTKQKRPGEWLPRLAHSSVRKFLEEKIIPMDDKADLESAVTGHAVLGNLCLRYLAYDNIWPQCDTSTIPPTLTLSNHPFLKYAATYFPTHAGAKSTVLMEDSIREFLVARYDAWSTWRESLAPLRNSTGLFMAVDLEKWNLSKKKWDYTSRLSFAAGLGLPSVVLDLLEEGDDPNDGTNYPLSSACNAGSVEVVKILLDHGADVHRSSKRTSPPLHRAAAQGNVEVLDLLLSHGADLEATDTTLCTALIVAIYNEKTPAARFLLEKGADPNVRQQHSWCPLNYAVNKNNQEIVELLLASERFDTTLVGNTTYAGHFPLLQAVNTGNAELVEIILSHGADIWQIGHDGVTSIYDALRTGKTDIAKMLFAKVEESVSHIEDKDERDLEFARLVNQTTHVEGYSLLHAAVFSKQLETVELALENNVGLNRKDGNGASALDSSIYLNCDSITERLLKSYEDSELLDEGSEYNLLHYASQGGSLKTFLFLLNQGFDIQELSFSDESVMYLAAEAGSIEVLQHILEHPEGVTLLELRDNYGYTPLLGAIEKKKIESVKLLLDHNADVLAKIYDGQSALDLAAYTGDVNLVELILDTEHLKDLITEYTLQGAAYSGDMDVFRLINKHCRIDALQSSNGATVLHAAADGGNDEIVSLILEQAEESILHARDEYGCLALCLAVCCGAEQIVRSLVERGSKVTECKNSAGNGVLDAAGKGYVNILKYFAQVDRDALMTARNRQKQTALHVASEWGQFETAKWLINEGFSMLDEDCYARSCLFMLARYGQWGIAPAFEESDWNLGIHRRDFFGQTPLLIAAATGTADSFRRFRNHGANIMDRVEGDWFMSTHENLGATVLHLAAGSGSTEIVRMIIDELGIECLTWQDAHGDYPLNYAVCGGNEHLLDLLCSKDVPLTRQDSQGDSLLAVSVMFNEQRTTEWLLQKGLGKVEREGRSRIIEMSGYRQVDTIQSLEGDGFDIRADSAFPELLHSAASVFGRGRLTKHLEKRGLKWTAVDRHGWTPKDCLLVVSGYQHDSEDKTTNATKEKAKAKDPNRKWHKKSTWLKPTRWCTETTSKSGFTLGDVPTDLKMSFPATEPKMSPAPRAYSITADHYLLPTREDSYFEISINRCGKTNRIGVGLERIVGETPYVIGYCAGAIAFYGDNATVKYNGVDTEVFGEHFGQGDIVGVGIDYDENTIFLTKNGVCLGVGGTDWGGRFLPAVSSAETELEITANFGQNPFVFDIGSHGYGNDSCEVCYGLSTVRKAATQKADTVTVQTR